MERTTIYLDAETKRRLKEAAKRGGVSEAFLIREALAGYLSKQKPARLKPVGKSTDGGVAERDEKALEELGFGRSSGDS